MKKNTILGMVGIFSIVFAGIVYQTYQLNEFVNGLGECGMSARPIYGDTIIIDRERLDLEQQLEIPNGKFGLLNLSDSLSPKLIKFDENENVIWAVEFREDSIVGIPHERLSEMKLIKDEYGIMLSFFNESYGEPGKVYLTEDYELQYMCLSPM